MDFSREEPNLPSDSDDSDEDYVPSGAESNPPSEVESDGEVEEDVPDDGEEVPKSKKRKVSQGNKRKVKKKGRNFQQDIDEEIPEKSTSEQKQELTEEEEKKRADSLWADFMKDSGPSSSSKSAVTCNESKKKEEIKTVKIEPPKAEEKENKVTVTKIFQFAGEEVSVTKEVPATSAEATAVRVGNSAESSSSLSPGVGRGRGRSSGGLASVLSQIGKKPKLGTLEKSKLDWDRFKKTEGIEDEVRTFNRGKDGYLEKQDFLQRTDVRQFEIEKGLRANRRSNR